MNQTPTFIGGVPLAAIEKRVAALEEHNGVVAQAARALACSPSTIKRAVSAKANLKTYRLSLVFDGYRSIPIGSFMSPDGFLQVCIRVCRMFSGTLKNLELPGYLIRDEISKKEVSLESATGRKQLHH